MESVESQKSGRACLAADGRGKPIGQERRLDDGAVELRDYLDAVRRRWRVIAIATLAAVVVTGIITKFVMTRWYRAEAIIRPVEPNVVQNQVSGLLGGLGNLGANLLGSEASNPASEYMPIMKSFEFTKRLIAGHGLDRHLDSEGARRSHGGSDDRAWMRYRQMQRRFECKFSLRTGNLTLYYKDPDRSMAGKILGFYISDLRELLRAEQIRDTSKAIASLRAESRDTGDSLLQTQLYELLARQVQEQKLAQLDADFAFKVLQPPTTPNRPYRPDIIRDSALAGVMMLMLMLAFVVLKTSLEQGS